MARLYDRTIARASGWSPERRRELIAAVKVVHSLAFLVIQSSIGYLLVSGVRRRTDRRAGIALGIAVSECAIYAGNGFRCPLTGVVEALGDEHGAVTDIFLPRWLARNIANIYTPMLLFGLALHARNIIRPDAHDENAG